MASKKSTKKLRQGKKMGKVKNLEFVIQKVSDKSSPILF